MTTDSPGVARSPVRWLALLLLLPMLLLVAAACTDDDGNGDDASPSPTAEVPDETSTPTDTETPAATPDGEGTGAPQVALEEVATGLTAPVDLAAPDDGSGRLFVVQQRGVIEVIDANGEMADEPFLDIEELLVEPREGFDERGLLGMTLHPDFAENGRFFVYYSAPARDEAPEGWDHTSHVSEFSVSADDENVADPDSERVIMQIDQPQFNHNAGHIAFGPDGYLYIPLGDGGGGNDNQEGHTPDLGNGQDPSNWLGSVLRIDVEGEGAEGQAYAVPDDNPFVGQDGFLPEIWVYGLRNPYDISFDAEGEFDLFIADAGQELYEWVNHASGGENFGWNIKEGSHCFDPDDANTEPEECPDEGANGEPLVDPIVEYARADYGTVIVGAELYRGTAISDLSGMLVVADWSMGGGQEPSGGLLVAEPGEADSMWDHQPLEIVSDMEGELPGTVALYVTGLARDAEGELYLLTNESSGPAEGSGALYRLVPSEGTAASNSQ